MKTMVDDDFDLRSLADYLHLEVGQVARLVERGNIPGRRVANGWRFSRPEIHLWLEQRIGVSDIGELARLEGALERATDTAAEPFLSLAELLPLEAIQVPLAARTRSSVISSMVDVAARTNWLWDTAKMVEAVRRREEIYPTALDNGVALMHPRRPHPSILARPFIALGINECGIPFGSSRGALTDVFFLISSMTDRGHLHSLARLSRLLATPAVLDELRRAKDPQSAHAVIATREQALLG
jgi:PTS system nitrogen regulatory IIA component